MTDAAPTSAALSRLYAIWHAALDAGNYDLVARCANISERRTVRRQRAKLRRIDAAARKR